MPVLLESPIDRRAAVRLGALSTLGLIVACKHLGALPSNSAVQATDPAVITSPFAGYLQIGTDNKIRFVTTRAECGQGISAGFAVLVAEELDVDPAAIEILYAGANNLLPKLSPDESQPTGGSSSTRLFYLPVRKSAAAARDMLMAAAAEGWGVPAAECTVAAGQVVHAGSQRRASYGSLAAAAAHLSVPQDPALKDPAHYKYIGKASRRTDIPAKVNGTAVFGIDVQIPGMLAATIIHCPYVGGDVDTLDDQTARAQPGVKNVVRTPYGVIVIADKFWHALNASRKLNLTWKQTNTVSSASILAKQKELVEASAMVVASTGDAAGALGRAAKKVEAYYQSQYLPHSTLEPQNCTAWVKSDGTCELWAPTQSPVSAAAVAAKILGISPSAVKVNVTLLGGGFGRRLRQDYIGEAVYAAKAMPNQPVKLIWQRSEEFTHDLYRPSSYAKMQAGLDAAGKLTAWSCRLACSSIYSWLKEQPTNLIVPQVQVQADSSSVEGADQLGYQIAHFQCEWAQYEPGVPVFWWRSVGHSQNAFFVESFLDECAHAAGADPIAFRLDLLTDKRAKAVLQLARDQSGWSTPPAAGVGRGVAVHTCFGSYVAQVIEVTIETGTIFVQKVTAVIDCGTNVDSMLVQTQMESAIAQGLAAAMKQEITLTNGRVNQNSFNACQPLLLSEMPAVTTIIVPSTAAPGGVGEAGVPPVAPALANAVFALLGQRLRTLPLKIGGS